MEIVEIEPEKKITISKIEYSCDILDATIPKPLFQNYSSFIILTAPPRSGKSTWILFIHLQTTGHTSVC